MSKESLEYKIEHAIRTTLIVLNKQSIDIAVEKIKNVIENSSPPKSAEEMRLDISHKHLGFMAPRMGYSHTERLDKAMQEYAEWYATQPNQEKGCNGLHSTDWYGKCFTCGEQVFVRESNHPDK